MCRGRGQPVGQAAAAADGNVEVEGGRVIRPDGCDLPEGIGAGRFEIGAAAGRGAAPHADLACAPRLGCQPLADVVSIHACGILPFAAIETGVVAEGCIETAKVRDCNDITVRKQLERLARIIRGSHTVPVLAAVVRRVHPEHRQFLRRELSLCCRPEDVDCEARAIANCHILRSELMAVVTDRRIASILAGAGHFFRSIGGRMRRQCQYAARERHENSLEHVIPSSAVRVVIASSPDIVWK